MASGPLQCPGGQQPPFAAAFAANLAFIRSAFSWLQPGWLLPTTFQPPAHGGLPAARMAVPSTEVDVRSIDGKELRAPGKPPWAGGWKQVGKDHPGWTQEKWDRWQSKMADKAKRHGVDCWPPGRCKQPGTPAAPSASGAPSS